MPTLADIYSAIDSAKRKGSDLIRNPGASLQQIAGYGMDRANAARDQLYQATEEEGIGYGPKTQVLAQKMAESYNPIGMTTWHGSPHVFERFDLSKLGTGEGAQAYGSGMYVAQSPRVAEEYKKNISLSNQLKKNQFNPDGTPNHVYQTAYQIDSGVPNDEVKLGLEALGMNKQNIQETMQKAQKLFRETSENTGSIYKVDLPDTHIRRMLDWDAPIKDQPIHVRKLAKSLGLDMSDLGGDLLAKVGKDEAGRKIMQDAGIRGVKYLDQNSRFSKEGTRNFVVFDPNHLTILERNNQAIK